MGNKRRATRVISGLIIIIVIWSGITILDYWRICHGFERPVFAVPAETADDGGSGTYKGLGYSFDIEGNFMPEDEFPGVTKARFYLLGKMLKEAIRD
ncbi:MAG TPA: hypothetical protein PLP71_05760 [Syntrophomonadaceae bacterium]|jgi:hypothetical protein|nr:hypothetical protein [Syntrophomonadaceae bacterium]HQD90512.1 hypothetical protein [Syntrophomonadaceae bacterium]